MNKKTEITLYRVSKKIAPREVKKEDKIRIEIEVYIL